MNAFIKAIEDSLFLAIIVLAVFAISGCTIGWLFVQGCMWALGNVLGIIAAGVVSGWLIGKWLDR